MPSGWENYQFKVQYKGRTIDILIHSLQVELTLVDGQALKVRLYEQDVALEPNTTFTQSLKS
ncbi:hypothetical protein D3C77_787300 [compost metagenome]